MLWAEHASKEEVLRNWKQKGHLDIKSNKVEICRAYNEERRHRNLNTHKTYRKQARHMKTGDNLPTGLCKEKYVEVIA